MNRFFAAFRLVCMLAGLTLIGSLLFAWKAMAEGVDGRLATILQQQSVFKLAQASAQRKSAPSELAKQANAADGHQQLTNDLSLYPTAAQCGECHRQIYEEWASSNHAYASISPMFHKFEQKFQELTQGTVGTFCVR